MYYRKANSLRNTNPMEDKTMSPYALREHFALTRFKTAITRADFEASFRKTRERITFTFNGWDGKSYDGESRTAYVYRTTIAGYEDVRFVKVGKALCYIDENSSVIEKATGIAHKTTGWVVDVERRD